MSDEINHPAHYNQGRIEVIDAIQDWNLGFCLGNAIKYIARANYKGQAIKDLKKAAWYLQREIESKERLLAISPESPQVNVAPLHNTMTYSLLNRLNDQGEQRFLWVDNFGRPLSPEFNTEKEAYERGGLRKRSGPIVHL